MPFFENARQFEIHGGYFVDLKGNQNNYHYNQSLNVNGSKNAANYKHGNYHNNANNITASQGANPRFPIDPATMVSQDSNYSPPPKNYRLGYEPHPNFPVSAPPQAHPYYYSPYPPQNPSLQLPPTDGMFDNNNNGHLNQLELYPPQQTQFDPISLPSSPQPMGHQHYAPVHHPQTSPNVRQIHFTQSTPSLHAAPTNGSLSSITMPQEPTAARVDPQTRPPLGTTVAQSSQSTAATETIISGATPVQSSGSTHSATYPSASTSVTAITRSSAPSTSAAVLPVARAQPRPITAASFGLTEYSDLIPRPGATVQVSQASSPDEEEEENKKIKKFFLRLLGKAPKEISLHADS